MSVDVANFSPVTRKLNLKMGDTVISIFYYPSISEEQSSLFTSKRLVDTCSLQMEQMLVDGVKSMVLNEFNSQSTNDDTVMPSSQPSFTKEDKNEIKGPYGFARPSPFFHPCFFLIMFLDIIMFMFLALLASFRGTLSKIINTSSGVPDNVLQIVGTHAPREQRGSRMSGRPKSNLSQTNLEAGSGSGLKRRASRPSSTIAVPTGGKRKVSDAQHQEDVSIPLSV